MKFSLLPVVLVTLSVLLRPASLGAAEPGAARKPAAELGYQWLLEKPYVSVDFDDETFNEVWKTWPEPLRSEAAEATPRERREMAFRRYGLTPRPGWEAPPGSDALPPPLQYVVDDQGNWTMNCFACHGGQVDGRVVPGLPNSNYAMQTLTEEILAAKLRLGKAPSRNELALPFIPLGKTNGTTNAVMFGVVLLAQRDVDLNVDRSKGLPRMVHHDMDAPPWWHFRKKKFLYCDGFVEKGHRALMQFALIPQNGPDRFREWEDDFRDVAAYLESLEPPVYPFAINRELASIGERLFETTCAECHGTYGQGGSYPERMVAIEEVGTDPVRLRSMDERDRGRYAESWFSRYGEKEVVTSPPGYVAPPLDGIWASAPYFHNGSVPTLWHVLHPDQRPRVWQRTHDGYDRERVGLEVTTYDRVPADVQSGKERRTYFDTSQFGKSAAGHTFPDQLDEAEKRALLEYLKTL